MKNRTNRITGAQMISFKDCPEGFALVVEDQTPRLFTFWLEVRLEENKLGACWYNVYQIRDGEIESVTKSMAAAYDLLVKSFGPKAV